MEADLSGQLSSFELMWSDFYDYVSQSQLAERPRPMPSDYPFYCLVEAMGQHPDQDRENFERALTAAIEDGQVEDVIIAQSERERANLWALRDDLVEAFRPLWPLISYDVSMALREMPQFVASTNQAIRGCYPEETILNYGHAGDGNLHIVVSRGGETLDERWLDDTIYSAVGELGGSISAEHGIGRSKQRYLHLTRSADEIDLMRTIKLAVDPHNIMNPHTMLPERATDDTSPLIFT